MCCCFVLVSLLLLCVALSCLVMTHTHTLSLVPIRTIEPIFCGRQDLTRKKTQRQSNERRAKSVVWDWVRKGKGARQRGREENEEVLFSERRMYEWLPVSGGRIERIEKGYAHTPHH